LTPSSGTLRLAALACCVYAVVAVVTAGALGVVGFTTAQRLAVVAESFEVQRDNLVQAMRTASAALRSSATATGNFRSSIDAASGAVDQASLLANDSAGTFRDLAAQLRALVVFGVQPLGGVAPQFDTSADQLQSLAISLGKTRDALGSNGSNVARVSGDLSQLQAQLDTMAASLDEPGTVGIDARDVLVLQLAFGGLVVLIGLQALGTLVLGIALWRMAGHVGNSRYGAGAADPVGL
jgi:hypothetical protein